MGRPSDEAAHVTFFAMLTATALAVEMLVLRGRTHVRVVVLTLGLAIGTEVAQATIASGRSGSAKDVVLNTVGIALGLMGFHVVRAVSGARAAPVLALISLTSLLGIGAVAVGTTVRSSDWWRCRGVVPVPLAQSVVDVSPGPIAEFDRDEGAWTWSGGRAIGRELASEPSRQLLCSVVQAKAYTIVITFVVPDSIERESVVITSGRSNRSEPANFEVVLEGEALYVQFRSGHGWRAPRLPVPREIRSGEQLTLVFNFQDGAVWAIVNRELMISAWAVIDFSAWDVGAQIRLGSSEVEVEHAALFGRRITNDELMRFFER